MSKIFEVDYRKGSLKDRVSGTIPTNTNVIISQQEKGRCVRIDSSADLDGYGIISGVKMLEICIRPSANTKLFQDDSADKLEISGGNYSGTGMTECYVNNSDSDSALLGQWQVVLAEFSAGINFATDLEIDPTAQIEIAYIRAYDTTSTGQQRTQLYNSFVSSKHITKPIVTNCDDATNMIVSIDGTNWNADGGTTDSSFGNLRKASGAFRCLEDATGKYIECTSNGSLQLQGLDLNCMFGYGKLTRIRGDLSGDQGSTVEDSTAFSWLNNILSIAMLNGQKLREFCIKWNDAYDDNIINIITTGSSFTGFFSGTANPIWIWDNGSYSRGLNPGKNFGSTATRHHTIYLGNEVSLYTYTYFHQRYLSGSIDPNFGLLSNLRYLYLQFNQLSGSIPDELGNLSNLQQLYLNNNQLSGILPDELGNLSDLAYLYLNNNQLSGSIPDGIFDISSLVNLRVQSNNFSMADLSDAVNEMWIRRVTLGGKSFSVNISDNNGITSTAIDQIEGTGAYLGDGLKDNGCTVTY